MKELKTTKAPETVTKTICPYCGDEVNNDFGICCGENHAEEIEVCAYCGEEGCDNRCLAAPDEVKHE